MGWPGQEMRMLGDAEKVFLGRDSIKCFRERVKSQKKLLFIIFLVNMRFEKDFFCFTGGKWASVKNRFFCFFSFLAFP